MANETATFAIELDTKGGGEAENLASTLADLQSTIKQDTAALREMQAALKAVQAGAVTDANVFKNLRDGIKAKQASIAEANASFVKLGGTFGKTAAGAEAVGTDLGAVMNAAKAGAGPMGGLFEKAQLLKGAFEKLGAAKAIAIGAVAGLAVAVIALTVAVVAGTIALMQFALAQADAARNSRLATEGLAASSKELAGLGAVLPKVANATGLGADELRKMAESLEAAGVKAKDLPDALMAVATAQAGGASASFIKQLNDDLKAGKKSAKELAAEVNAKFGGIVAAKLLSLDSQAKRFKSNLAAIFADIKIEPLLKALAEIVALFDSSTASGRALKAMAEGLLQPLFDALVYLKPLAVGLFKGMVIGALMLTVAVLKVKNVLKDAFGDSLADINLLKVGVYLGVAAFAVLAALGVVLLGVLASIALAVAFIAIPFLIIGAIIGAVIYGVIAVIGLLADAFTAAYEFISGLSFGELGANIVQSIADAITGGAQWVWDAMKGLASGAIGAFKGALGIASPSKVFMKAGGDIGAGVVQGVDNSGSKVDDAVSTLVTPPGGDKGAAATGKAGGNTYQITLHGVKGEDLETESFWSKVAGLLEAASASASPEPSNA